MFDRKKYYEHERILPSSGQRDLAKILDETATVEDMKAILFGDCEAIMINEKPMQFERIEDTVHAVMSSRRSRWLLHMRQSRGLSIDQACDILKISEQCLRAYEEQRANCPDYVCQSFAYYLELSALCDDDDFNQRVHNDYDKFTYSIMAEN